MIKRVWRWAFRVRTLVPAVRRGLLASAVIMGAVASAAAQELEPRGYSASPVGVNFAGAAYAYSTGAIVYDALQLSPVRTRISAP